MRLRASELLAAALVGILLVSGCATGTPQPSVAAATSVQPSPSAEQTPSATTEETDTAPPGAIDIQLGPGPKFEPRHVTAKAGTAVFFLHNVPGAIGPHNFLIGSERPHLVVASPTLLSGDSVVFTVSGLEPGTYTYWCGIEGHADAGMVGELTVTP